MAFAVNQSSNVYEDAADILLDGVVIARIMKGADKPVVVSVFADGPEPTHVIDFAVKSETKSKRAKTETPAE